MPATSELLLRWDKQRARSQQKQIGWSEIGGCRRRAGYRFAGAEPDNAGGSVQAVMGTAIDEACNAVAAQLGLVTQQEITYLGIVGHFDRIEGDEVVDVKTVGTDRWLEHMEIAGPPRQHQFQVTGYGAAVMLTGVPITRVRIDYIARDTGREWSWRSRFDPLILKAAVEWITLVRDTPVDMLPRDYDPDSMWCQGCPFLRTCWGERLSERDQRAVIHAEDPDTARYAGELKAARDQIKVLEERAERLAGILDAVRPDDRYVLVEAGPWLLEFRPTRSGGHAIYFRGRSAIKKGARR